MSAMPSLFKSAVATPCRSALQQLAPELNDTAALKLGDVQASKSSTGAALKDDKEPTTITRNNDFFMLLSI
jgi:hypothetical protein